MDEMKQISDALYDLKHRNGAFEPPKVTIIIAQRQSNYRIVPQNINPHGRPMEQVYIHDRMPCCFINPEFRTFPQAP